jgi:hypothetical protein
MAFFRFADRFLALALPPLLDRRTGAIAPSWRQVVGIWIETLWHNALAIFSAGTFGILVSSTLHKSVRSPPVVQTVLGRN